MNSKIKDFINECKTKLYDLSLDEAIVHAEQIGLLLRDNEVGIYSLNDIESYFINNLLQILSKCSKFENFDISAGHNVLFIATEVYHTGGHSRLMERLSTFLVSEADLLVTKFPSNSIIEREMKYFSNVHYGFNHDLTLIDRVSYILEILLKYDVFILNTHPEDIFTIVVCGLAKKIKKSIKVYFVNHADHTFSYGCSIADVWYEISAYGREIDKKRELSAEKCFLGIPIDISSYKDDFNFKNGDLILTAASRGKYKPFNGESIMPLIDALLRKYPDSTVQVIGINLIRDYWWWGVKLKYWKRLKTSKKLPYEQYLNITKDARLYIDSHPTPGGTAFAEQFLNGVLCCGLNSDYKGYSQAEILKKDNIDEVLNFVDCIDLVELDKIKSMIDNQNSYDMVKHRFNQSLEGKYSDFDYGIVGNKISIRCEDELKKIPLKLCVLRKSFFEVLNLTVLLNMFLMIFFKFINRR
ncbi:hypothetical protein [Aeromonas veronii]|uniref:hypothetical protein n=1 Tax=Aeromonas veronii TaxID=654 RepID=UPI003D24DE30